MSNCLRPHELQHPGFPVLHNLQKPAQTHVHGVRDTIQRLILLPLLLLPSIFPRISLFQLAGSSHKVVRVLELQLQPHSCSEYSGLISFRIDGFDLLAVQGTLKSLLQHHSSKALVLWHSDFFMV